MTMSDEITFELVNDKAELEKALGVIADSLENNAHDWDAVPWREVETLIELVPRLMASYEEAVELAYGLTKAWESYRANQTPAGLYVP